MTLLYAVEDPETHVVTFFTDRTIAEVNATAWGIVVFEVYGDSK